MKYLGIAALAALVLTAVPANAAKTWLGNPSPNGTWTATDGSVWVGGVAPGNEYVYIQNGGTATVNTDIIASQVYDQLFVQNASTLNITSTGRLQSTWSWLETGSNLNLAGYFSPLNLHVKTALSVSSPTAQLWDRGSITLGEGGSAGSMTQAVGIVRQDGRSLIIGNGGTGSYTLSGGTLNVGYDRGYDTWVGGATNGTYAQSGGSANLRVLHVGQTALGGQATISGGSLTTAAMLVGGDLFYTAGVGTFKVVGSGATSIVANENVYDHPERAENNQTYQQTAGGTLEYVFDQGGVTPISVQAGAGWAGNVKLAGTLKVDVTGYAEIGAINLMNYAGAVTGAFNTDTVTIQSFDAVAPPGNLLQPWTPVATPQLLPQGFYYLNYANNKNITLLFNVPEPATLSLLALSGLAALRRRSRRA